MCVVFKYWMTLHKFFSLDLNTVMWQSLALKVSWDMTVWSLVCTCQLFRGACCLHLRTKEVQFLNKICMKHFLSDKSNDYSIFPSKAVSGFAFSRWSQVHIIWVFSIQVNVSSSANIWICSSFVPMILMCILQFEHPTLQKLLYFGKTSLIVSAWDWKVRLELCTSNCPVFSVLLTCCVIVWSPDVML